MTHPKACNRKPAAGGAFQQSSRKNINREKVAAGQGLRAIDTPTTTTERHSSHQRRQLKRQQERLRTTTTTTTNCNSKEDRLSTTATTSTTKCNNNNNERTGRREGKWRGKGDARRHGTENAQAAPRLPRVPGAGVHFPQRHPRQVSHLIEIESGSVSTTYGVY